MFDDDRIKSDLRAVDIYQIANDLGRQVNRAGMIHCTFHDEKTPSMKLDRSKGRFKCFGCEKSGDTIDLYMSVGHGIDFKQAVQEMKSRYLGVVDGQPRPPRRLAKPVVVPAQPPARPAEDFSPIYLALQAYCRQHPPTDAKRQALTYLQSRAFTADTIKHFGVFVIPDSQATSEYLTATFPEEELVASGLFSPRTDKRGIWFMFHKHPILIPYLKGGQLVNLQGRCIGKPAEGKSKYQYLRERSLKTMFNLDVLSSLEKGSEVYLTEGAFDTMSVFQKGGTAVSINSATLFKPEWVSLFAGLKVCFLLDTDPAGQKAVDRIVPLFRKQRIPVSKITLPDPCKDVNDWLVRFAGQPNGYPAFWDR